MGAEAPPLAPTSALTAADADWMRAFLRDRPLMRLYFAAAMEDLARGLDNRMALVGRARAGAVLGIAFDDLAVFTALGRLDDDELALPARTPMPAELHVEPAHEPFLADLCRGRLLGIRDLLAYGRSPRGAALDPGARRLGRSDLDRVLSFTREHNDRAVLSEWMLDAPFFAFEEEGAIVATAGTLARADGLALIGSFLTRPDLRGRGLGRRLALHLAAVLGAEGIATVMLATTADNAAACRAYEAAGFALIDRRRQMDLAPAREGNP